MTTRRTVTNGELFQSDNCSLRKLVQAVYYKYIIRKWTFQMWKYDGIVYKSTATPWC